MTLLSQRILKDFLWILVYFIVTSIAAVFFGGNFTEGYLFLIGIVAYSFLVSLLSAIAVLAYRLISKNANFSKYGLQLFLLLTFEIAFWVVLKEPILFGILDSSTDPNITKNFAASASSAIGVLALFGYTYIEYPKIKKPSVK